MTIPQDLKYTATHEWVRLDENGIATVGITEHAQQLLGDLVFVELPEIDAPLEVGADSGVLESVKAASDLYAPVSGMVVAVNAALADEPQLINRDPYHDGWLMQIKVDEAGALDSLLDAGAYSALIED